VRILCPAKINTFLSVGPRDRRGYHPLRTVFQAISLYDELTLEHEEAFSFESDVPLPEENTVVRTARLLGEVAHVPPLRVSLSKGIPSESGLGGGSSDAAGFIRGVAKITGKPMPEVELRSVAGTIGADVPFFLVGGRAQAEGYGERLTPLPDLPIRWLVVVKPEVACPTGEMFRKLDELSFEWREFSDGPYNDFERVAPPESLNGIERLQTLGADGAGLTGSGSAVYGFFGSESQAKDAAERAMAEGLGQAWAVHTLTRAESR